MTSADDAEARNVARTAMLRGALARLRTAVHPPGRLVPGFLLFSLVSVQALPAQVIRGALLDDLSGRRLTRGTLSLLTTDSVQVTQTRTDRRGAFVLPAVPPGSYRLRAERAGFMPAVAPATQLKAGDTLQVQVVLSRRAVVLNPMVVQARRRGRRTPLDDYYHRLDQLPWGRFVTLEEIERRHAVRTTDLLRTVPGVQLVAARRSTGSHVLLRGCAPVIVLDGNVVPLMSGMTIDDFVKPSELEGIEVYGNAFEAPTEYIPPGACSAVLLWTRRGEDNPAGGP
jgi:hypothetical protein